MDIFLILLVAAFIAYRFLTDKVEEGRKVTRDNEKIAMRRASLARSPRSATSYESLGDALREADRYAEALYCYEVAQSLIVEGEASGSGPVGGSGLESKVRLTKLDIKEVQERPASYLEQVARRESVCHQCSTLNTADATHCVNCGLVLPTNTILETWHRDEIRKPILREIREGAIMIAVVLFALYLASWMPLEIKGLLLISTICVLVWKGMRAITDK